VEVPEERPVSIIHILVLDLHLDVMAEWELIACILTLVKAVEAAELDRLETILVKVVTEL
jgi:hypothetical protein